MRVSRAAFGRAASLVRICATAISFSWPWELRKIRTTSSRAGLGDCRRVFAGARTVSFLHFGGPVEKDGERRGIGFVHFRDDEESLPVATHIVGEDVLRGDRLPPVGLK